MTHSPVCCGDSPPARRRCGRKPGDWCDERRGCWCWTDTTLDKPYAKRMELVSRHWSGKHKRVVWGINLLTLLWTDGNALIPCDFRVYDRPLSGLTKNDHFRQMAGGGGGAGLSAPLGAVRQLVYQPGEFESHQG